MRYRHDRQHPAWLLELKKLPAFDYVISRLFPQTIQIAEFYQTSTHRKLNTIDVSPFESVHVSPDGQWLIGKIKEPASFALYSTAALTRWPGYLFVLAALLIPFWRRART